MSSSTPTAVPSSPPYPPRGASMGGSPTKGVDIPISAVFILLFACAAALNMTIFQINRRRNHKFIISAVTFGFCMARIMANVLRIVWACYPTNTRLAIAASVFANAGVLLLYIVNIIFFQRILRALHPNFGWRQPVRLAFRFLYFGVFACLVMVITAVVYSFYTLDASVLSKIRDVRLVASVYIAVLSFIPIPGILLCLLFPRLHPADHFGHGSMNTKIILVLFTATLLALGASLRAGVAFLPVRPITDPGWFNHKAVFYCFSYVIELIVVYTYALMRMDKRFHIPNGSSAPWHYSNGVPNDTDDATIEKSANEEPILDEEAQRTK
ncbi:unnamed protein product [Clonostachys rhizophaga]|uniref:Family c-likeg-protein-coupled receptor protein n=1 Tax=Clonostachys rhizophaga TaxID=160324 RepID=A0A9N9YDZ7_9HYPO|nr:unnamed protein product [Clonostachys rhizophaga]